MSNEFHESNESSNDSSDRLATGVQRSAPSQLVDALAGDSADPAQHSSAIENARQSDAQPVDDVVCARCSTVNRADDELCSRCKSFLPKNQLQRQHGIYSRLPPPADLRETVAALRAGVISDRGGDAELTTLERAYIEKLGDLEVTIRLLTQDIAVHGLMTKSGGVRNVYDKLLMGLAAFDRYAQRITLERRSKRVESLDALMKEPVEHRSNGE
jgi:hypothetical protein